jgi:hypothetical protein
METDKLRAAYAQNKVVQAICDHLSKREKNQNETKLHRMLQHLGNDGHEVKKSAVIAAFRELEEAGCGQYVEGRHGWPSRFVWSVKTLHVSAAARGDHALEQDLEDNDAEDDPELLEHSFNLRPGVVVTMELPADLTKGEASRLAAFIQTLPFDDEA